MLNGDSKIFTNLHEYLNSLDNFDKNVRFRPKNRDELKELTDINAINLGQIDTSLITNMCTLFFKSSRIDYSGIETWDVSNVHNMKGMFAYSHFNNDINDWDVSNVTCMDVMFYQTPFNHDLDKWDVSKVIDM